jgi:hypothetical protein
MCITSASASSPFARAPPSPKPFAAVTREAAEQGAERDFCQCAHADCSEHVHANYATDTAGLPGSIMFAPGSVTITYSDPGDLCDQLILLAARLYTESGSQAHPRMPLRRVRSASATLDKSA